MKSLKTKFFILLLSVLFNCISSHTIFANIYEPNTNSTNINTVSLKSEEINVTGVEVIDSYGNPIDTVTIPYGTVVNDIAKAIDTAITVNVVEDGKVKEADVKFEALDIKERVESVKIAYSDYSKIINVKYETKNAYIAVENTDMLLLYPDYDGKTDEELAKFIYENACIVVFDEYGIATDLDYNVTFVRDAKDETLAKATVTAKHNDKDLEAKLVKVTLQPLGSTSPSGTVVRPSIGGGGGGSSTSSNESHIYTSLIMQGTDKNGIRWYLCSSGKKYTLILNGIGETESYKRKIDIPWYKY